MIGTAGKNRIGNCLNYMMITDFDLHQTLTQCAPSVGINTLKAIVSVESGGHPYAVFDNGPASIPYPQRLKYGKSYRFSSQYEAAQKVSELIKKGHVVDIGLMQINQANMKKMGLSPQQILNPCTNVRAAAHLLKDNYQRAAAQVGEGQNALIMALRAYNTGRFQSSVGDKYVIKLKAALNKVKPDYRRDFAYSTPQSAPSYAYPAAPIVRNYGYPIGSEPVNSAWADTKDF